MLNSKLHGFQRLRWLNAFSQVCETFCIIGCRSKTRKFLSSKLLAPKPVTPWLSSRYKYIFLVKVPARASLHCYYYHFTVLTCYECAIVRIIFICICMRGESYDDERICMHDV